MTMGSWGRRLCRNGTVRAGIIVAAMLGGQGAVAADWQAELQAPAAGAFAPRETLRLFIPPAVPVETLGRLRLELDNIDVTALVRRDGNYALFTPAQPLAPGDHSLRLVEYFSDGSYAIIGQWQLPVRQSSAFREASFNGDVYLSANQRVGDMGLQAPVPDRFQSQGSASIRTALANGDWRAELTGDATYVRNEELSPTGRELDLGEYLLTFQYDDWATLRAGHHALGHTSVVMDNFRRRGVSGAVAVDALNSELNVFALHGTDLLGVGNGLGLNDEQDQVSGGVWDLRPFSDQPQWLHLSTIYVDGESPSTGITTAGGDPQATEGDVWGVVADSLIWRQQLRLRGEYAESEHDFDGPAGFDPIADEAEKWLINVAPTPFGDPAAPWALNLGAETSTVGAFYKSLANPTLVSDRESERAYLSLSKGGWNVSGSTLREEDNVEDDPLYSNRALYQDYVSLGYNASERWGWLGTPGVTLSHSRARIKDLYTAPSEWPIASKNTGRYLQTQFSYNTWAWSLGVFREAFDDDNNYQSDTRTRGLQLGFNLTLPERAQLDLSTQFLRTEDQDFGTDYDSATWNLRGQVVVIRNTLDLAVSTTYDERDNPMDVYFPMDDTNLTFSGELVWHVVEARPNRPGVDISLNHVRGDFDDNLWPSNSQSSHQTFLNLIVRLPAAVPSPAGGY